MTFWLRARGPQSNFVYVCFFVFVISNLFTFIGNRTNISSFMRICCKIEIITIYTLHPEFSWKLIFKKFLWLCWGNVRTCKSIIKKVQYLDKLQKKTILQRISVSWKRGWGPSPLICRPGRPTRKFKFLILKKMDAFACSCWKWGMII